MYKYFESQFGLNIINVQGYKGPLTLSAVDADMNDAVDVLIGALQEKGFTGLVNREHNVLEIVPMASLNKNLLPLHTDPAAADLTSRSNQLVRAMIHVERADVTYIAKTLRERAKLPRWVRVDVDVFKNTLDLVATAPLLRGAVEAIEDMENETKAIVKGAAVKTLQLRHLPAYQAFQMVTDFFSMTIVKGSGSANPSGGASSGSTGQAAALAGMASAPATPPKSSAPSSHLDLKRMHAAYAAERKLACYLDERSNSLIINGLEGDVNDIELYVRMVDRPALSREGLSVTPSTQVFPLQFASASDAVEMLGTLLQERAVQMGTVTNPPIENTPAPTQSGPRITASPPSSTESAAPALQKVPLKALGAGGLVLVADGSLNAVVALGLPEDLLLVESLLKQIDKEGLQVLIDVTVLDVELTDDWEFGVAYRMKNQQLSGAQVGGGAGVGMLHFPTGLSSPDGFGSQSTPIALASGVLDADSSIIVVTGEKLNAFLHLVQREGRAELVSAPKILTKNNREAFIGFQDELWFEQTGLPTRRTLPNGDIVFDPGIPEWRLVKAGTRVTVTPHVSESGSVSLDLQLEMSEFGAREKQGSPPPKKNRTSTQMVSVQQGNTLIIGGIIREGRSRRVLKTPILSDLPLIGPIFSSTRDSISKKETVFLMTPTVMKNSQYGNEYMKEYRSKRPELPWPKKTEE